MLDFKTQFETIIKDGSRLFEIMQDALLSQSDEIVKLNESIGEITKRSAEELEVWFVENNALRKQKAEMLVLIETQRNQIKQFEEQLKQLKERKLFAMFPEPAAPEVWPVDGDNYYFLDSANRACQIQWQSTNSDEFRLADGNCFKTKDEAVKASEKIVAIVKWRSLANKSYEIANEGAPPIDECYAVWNYTSREPEHRYPHDDLPQGVILFAYPTCLDDAIESLTDDETCYIFGITKDQLKQQPTLNNGGIAWRAAPTAPVGNE